jgi:arsenate reductase (glutaredoxin)
VTVRLAAAMPKQVIVFHYPACSTCKKALKWLEAHGVEHERAHIVETPPTVAKLREVLRLSGLPVSKLFNTSGVSYREGGFKSRLATMSEDEALAALAADGKLIKRPLVIGEGFALVGFREAEYSARF